MADNDNGREAKLVSLKEANKLLQSGHYRDAAVMYEKLQTVLPENIHISFNYMLARKKAGLECRSLNDCLSVSSSENTNSYSKDELQSLNISTASEIELRQILGAVFPLLSIVIPCYNLGATLENTINKMMISKSVPFEVIVVDDGSTDGSVEILKRLSSKYINMTTIFQQNSGAGGARNKAIPKCRGGFTFFLDADDEMDLAEISKAVVHAMTHRYDLLFVSYRVFDVEKNWYIPMYPDDLKCYQQSGAASSQNELRNIACKVIGYPWNRIISTRLLQQEKILFCETLVHNDMLYHWQSICKSRSIGFWDGVVCTHIKNTSGSLSSDTGARRMAVFDAMKITWEALNDDDIFNLNRDVWNKNSNRTLRWNRSIISKSVIDEFELRLQQLNQIGVVDVLPEEVPISLNDQSYNQGKPVKRPLVSIITITKDILGTELFNKNRNISHFEKMIKSVQMQTYGRDAIEHIIIDGASEDGTTQIAKQYLDDGRVNLLISEPDSGVYNAMNKGIKNSKGDMLLFLNAHDYLAPHAIETLVAQLKKTNSDYCFGNSVTVDEHDHPIGQHKGDINRILFGMPFCHQASIFTRRLFNKIMYPEDMKITTWKFVVELYLAGHQHSYCDDVLAFFRSGGLSTSKEHSQLFWKELRGEQLRIAKKVLHIESRIYDKLRDSFKFDLHDSSIDAEVVEEILKFIRAKRPLSVFQTDFLARLVVHLRFDIREIKVA